MNNFNVHGERHGYWEITEDPYFYKFNYENGNKVGLEEVYRISRLTNKKYLFYRGIIKDGISISKVSYFRNSGIVYKMFYTIDRQEKIHIEEVY